ncbi:hypothetical protein [Sphaerisporangium sp. NPDC051011]|uniref:hypothetical protein n=1 Tax=Sphaerisporangium sp. NPDC051011 TaxID=3155792 RepID=UPI0033FDEE50
MPEPIEFVDEFGEPIPLRPNACPNCGKEFQLRIASTCWNCGTNLDPLERQDPGPDDPSQPDD